MHQNQIHQNSIFPRGGINLSQALAIAVQSAAVFQQSIFVMSGVFNRLGERPLHAACGDTYSAHPYSGRLLEHNWGFVLTKLFCKFEMDRFYSIILFRLDSDIGKNWTFIYVCERVVAWCLPKRCEYSCSLIIFQKLNTKLACAPRSISVWCTNEIKN